MAKPYTPDTLAVRWDCSAETIRQMIRTGQLPGFLSVRLLRAYLDGYRPADWPVKPMEGC